MFRQLTYLTLAISLLLAGCYQKAGVAYQAGEGEATATASGITSVESTPLPMDDGTPLAPDSGGIAITIISPTLESGTQPTADTVLPTQEIFITPPPRQTLPRRRSFRAAMINRP